MTTTVDEVVRVMEHLAPRRLAEKWDNVGLQVGRRDWPVNSVWISLDPLPDVVDAACREKVDLLITHHPLIFNPLRMIDFSRPEGKVIRMAAQGRLAIYAAHTNLDSVSGGLNDMLARRIGLKHLRPIVGSTEDLSYKLVVLTPAAFEDKLFNTLLRLRSGMVGARRPCSFSATGKAAFFTEPAARAQGRDENGPKGSAVVRIESEVSASELEDVVGHLRTSHHDEILAYDLYPLSPLEPRQGIGRLGELPTSTDLKSLALGLKQSLGLASLRIVGEPGLTVKKVAICTGSGGSLLTQFLASSAAVFISGDFKYHEAREAQAEGRGLIDIGHFASERIMVPELADRLRAAMADRGITLDITACTLEIDPFIHV